MAELPGSQRRQLRALGERLIQHLLEDEGLSVLVDGEIRRRIASGELVQADSLMLGGAVVVRASEFQDLRERVQAFDEAIYRAQCLADSGDMRAAMDVLDVVRPAEVVLVDEDGEVAEPGESEPDESSSTAVDNHVDEPEPDKRGEPDDGGRRRVSVRVAPAHVSQVEQRTQNGGGDGPVPLEQSGKPKAMPDRDKVHSCDRCDDDNVPGSQAQMSFTRTREKLCRQCLIAWKPAQTTVA